MDVKNGKDGVLTAGEGIKLGSTFVCAKDTIKKGADGLTGFVGMLKGFADIKILKGVKDIAANGEENITITKDDNTTFVLAITTKA